MFRHDVYQKHMATTANKQPRYFHYNVIRCSTAVMENITENVSSSFQNFSFVKRQSSKRQWRMTKFDINDKNRKENI